MITQKQVTNSTSTQFPPEIRFSTPAKRWVALALVALLVILLFRIEQVLPPFVWAIVTAYLFERVIKRLDKQFPNTKRWIKVLAVYFTFIIVLIVGIVLLVTSIINQGKTLYNDAPNIQRTLDDYIANNPTVTIFGVELQTDNLKSSVIGATDTLKQLGQDLGPKFLSGFARFVIDFILYIIATLYFMLLGAKPIRQFINTLPLQYRSEIRGLVTRVDNVS